MTTLWTDPRKRREVDTLHKVFSRLHQSKAYKGNSDNYGQAVAMLAGDVALCLAHYFALNSRFNVDVKILALSQFIENLIKTGLGQAMDVNLTVRGEDITTSEVRRMTLYKTAFYTVVAPMQLGAILGGASEHMRSVLEGFGRPLGEAFQLQDDILGIFGTEKAIGKSVISDLKEGKRTFLIQCGIERAGVEDKRFLLSVLGRDEILLKDLEKVRDILSNCGAKAMVEKEAHRLKAIAQGTIPAITKDPRLRSLLHDICEFVVARTT
jgi:geranylgeranyl diphosphate synthase type I